MRHPFQRKSNDKETVQSPFQKILVGFIQAYNKGGQRMSGRKLSALLGKSSNHISQMLNDGFVPSGEALLEMAERLELTSEDTDSLITAAMATKLDKRSRDHFWIAQTLRMISDKDAELRALRLFLKHSGQVQKFEAWRSSAEGQSACNAAEDAQSALASSDEASGGEAPPRAADKSAKAGAEPAKASKKAKSSSLKGRAPKSPPAGPSAKAQG